MNKLFQNNFLEIKDLVKTYKSLSGELNHALKGISLSVNKGEILGLLGPNGAGKTTLASIIVTLIPATSGDILCDGVSIYQDVFEFRKIVGFCPQKPNLYQELTIEQNLFFAAKLYGCSDLEAKDRVDKLIARYRLTKYRNQFIKELSGGYKQRASIARTLIHQPKLVLFDEPTVGLDPHIRRELWQEIKELKGQGTSVVLTTHYLDEAEILSDRVCVLSEGLIKFVDTPSNLKTSLNKNSLEEVLVGLFED